MGFQCADPPSASLWFVLPWSTSFHTCNQEHELNYNIRALFYPYACLREIHVKHIETQYRILPAKKKIERKLAVKIFLQIYSFRDIRCHVKHKKKRKKSIQVICDITLWLKKNICWNLLTKWCGFQDLDGSQTVCEPVRSHEPGMKSQRSGVECVWRAWWSSSGASCNSYLCWGPPELSCSSCGRRSFPPEHLSWPGPMQSPHQLNQIQPQNMGCPSSRPESLTEAC